MIVSKKYKNINMEKQIKKAIEQYQCCGCVVGGNTSCFGENMRGGVGCGKHYAGTMMIGIGKFFLGLPKGFNRLGVQEKMIPNIYETFTDSEWTYDMFNVPVWKFLTKDGHTLVRGIMPRKNEGFIHIFLENCIDKIDCLELSDDDLDKMD